MKISDLQEGFREDSAQEERLEEAYEEIALLKDAFDRGNFGILIGKTGMLNYTDIREIKRKIAGIIRSNPLIDEDEVSRGRDGFEGMRVSLRKFGHRAELLALGAAFVGLSGIAAVSTPTVIGTVVAGTGAALTGAAAIHQSNIIGSLNTLSRVLDLADKYGELSPREKPSKFRRILNTLLRKKPAQIEKEARSRIKQAAKKAQQKMEKSLKGLPEFIEYKDRTGEIKQFPTANLFDI